ncbi:MAG: TRAP transporter small permease subunit, partial [Hyphomicrobiaceae bacterium]
PAPRPVTHPSAPSKLHVRRGAVRENVLVLHLHNQEQSNGAGRGEPVEVRTNRTRRKARRKRTRKPEPDREVVSNIVLLAYGSVAFLALAIVVWSLARPLLPISRAIDRMNVLIGQTVAWALLVAVVISTANAIVRKVFSTSSNSWLEAQWILFGAVFLLCAPWTLIQNEHIRIDIVSSLLPRRIRSGIEYVGHLLFLIPTGLVMVYTSWPFFVRSWLQDEQSSNAGGLPVYPAKFLVLLGFVLLLLQGFSELVKRTAIIRGLQPDTLSEGHGHGVEQEAERLKHVIAEEAQQR